MSSHHDPPSVQITLNLIRGLRPSKVFSNHKSGTPISSIAYDKSGQYLLSSGTDETLQLYEVPRGRHLRSIYSKKYGCHLAMFSNTSHSRCIFASTKENHILRLLNLNDNSFIRYFKGHSQQVINLTSSTSATRIDSFYSSSLDRTVKTWDNRVDGYTASLGMDSTPLIAIDPTNTLMAVLETASHTLRLVAMEKFPSGLIASAQLDLRGTPQSIQFTNDNKYIVVSMSGDAEHVIVDSFNLQVVGTLAGRIAFSDREYPCCPDLTVTPNGSYAIGGSGDGTVLVWSLKGLDTKKQVQPVAILPAADDIVPRMVAFDPRFEVLAVADTEVSFWLSKEN